MVVTRAQKVPNEAREASNEADPNQVSPKSGNRQQNLDKEKQFPGRPEREPRDGESQRNSRSSSSESSEPEEETQIFQWQGILLPQFEIPQWRTRAGVPAIVLRPVKLDDRIIPSNNLDQSPADVGTDSQSDHSPLDDPDAPVMGHDKHHPVRVSSRRVHMDKENFASYHKDIRKYDVRPLRLRIEGDATADEIDKWSERLSKFIRSPFGLENFAGGGWHGVKPLGRGGFGMAGLWKNEHDIVCPDVLLPWSPALINVQYMVVKQVGKRKRDKCWDP
ncbi:MAG: hypothetical protein Q9166_002420 [cf. Caloplaca sp. 2 TL-2023]